MKRDLNENLVKITQEILEDKTTNICKISVVLVSAKDPEFSVFIDEVNLIIEQDFVSKYTDWIRLNFSLSFADYIKAIKVYQDLRCNVVIVSDVDDDGDITDNDVIEIDQKIVFRNKDDLFKMYHKSEIVNDDITTEKEAHHSRRIEISAELIDDNLFEIRKRQMSFIARDTTLEKVLHFIVGRYNPDYKCILKPDNETVYKNITIPGMMSFDKIFSYLDKNYSGIYNTGLGYYWSEKTMYIYPLYNSDPILSPYVTHIYFIGEGTVAGGGNFCIKKDDGYHILSNRKVQSKQLTEMGTENFGNGFLIQKNSLLFDKWREQSQEDFAVIEEGIIRMQLDNANTLSEYSHNLRFKYGEESLAECRAALSSISGTITSLQWEHAKPFIIKPGWKLVYHYDSADSYETKTASCLFARYEYNSVGRKGADRIYSCIGELKLFTES